MNDDEIVSRAMSILASKGHANRTPEEERKRGQKANLASQKVRKIGRFKEKKLSTGGI